MIVKSVFVQKEGQHIQVKPNEIVWIASEGSKCKVHTISESYLVKTPLKKLLKKLSDYSLIQIHQQFAINSEQIVSIDLLKNKVYLENKELPLGSVYKVKIVKQLNCI